MRACLREQARGRQQGRRPGEAFNITNGDVFRWERMWEDIARHLGLDVAPPVPLKLAQHMADKGPVWKRIAERHGLMQPDLSKLVGWPFCDFIFHTESYVISNVNKIYEFAFTESMDAPTSLIAPLCSL